MSNNETETRVYDFIPDPFPNKFQHLPFPHEGDIIWVGDDMGTVVDRSFEPLMGKKREGDDVYTRYAELKITIKI